VRVTSVLDSGLSDSSDALFTLSPIAVTVTAPNGGEVWTAGTVQSITWTSTNVASDVKIELSMNGGASWTTLVASTANDGSESWTVPSTPSTQARVRVTSVASAGITDSSDANFTLLVPIITVTSPNGGETWLGESVHAITWSHTSVTGNVTLEASIDNGATWTVVSANTANDGTESWTVPNVGTTQARVRVTSVNNPTVSDTSNTVFTLAPVTLTITSPNGGEVWDAGSAHTITWTSTNVSEQVRLEYSPDGGATWIVLAASTANDGTEPWTLPTAVTTQGRVRVTALSGSPTDSSNAEFTIRYRGGVLKAPARINFGNVKVGKPKTLKVSLSNTSKTENLVITVVVTGTGYDLPDGPATFTILPKKALKLPVRFSPLVTGAHAGQLIITSSDRTTPLSVSMSGVGK
jgi:hypothetical protein